MKAILVISALLLCSFNSKGQITSPIIRAGFGVDADLQRNFFNNTALPANDDWFHYPGSEDLTGDFVIDTSGASAIYNGYSSNPSSRFSSFVRGMRYPLLSVINNHIYYDAVFIRDYHGTDSTSFTGGSKNGQSPADWVTTISPVLAKNDIVDGYLHVRRDGILAGDSLWFFGAVAIMGTNGDRYFDFELYQTDISYNRSTKKFENYGPDAGHTSWQFAADGSTARVGDIILTAEYGNAGLSMIEARIWVQKTALTTVTPQAFSWTGSFDGDGAGAAYGYAGIVPKTGGAFYQGLQNAVATSTGPFGTIKSGDIGALTYDPIQFMEFSVNLTKLGLDPMSFTTGSMCNLAFGKVLIKTRTSTSFTASITDFASPFSFRAIPEVDLAADIPFFCEEQNVANIWVLNPLPTSTYTFTTIDGHILSSGPTSVAVDSPGTYIVIQTLLDGCAEGGRDTVIISRFADNNCVPLASGLTAFTAARNGADVQLSYTLSTINEVRGITIQRAADNKEFVSIHRNSLSAFPGDKGTFRYTDMNYDPGTVLYYRVMVTEQSGYSYYSRVIAVKSNKSEAASLSVIPNPVKAGIPARVEVMASAPGPVILRVADLSGRQVFLKKISLQNGVNQISLTETTGVVPAGLYFVSVSGNNKEQVARLLVQ